jgi:hypothetical protein
MSFLNNGFLLGVAGVVAACGGLVSTVLASRRTRDEERVACEEKLRIVRLEAGGLSEQLYDLRKRREVKDEGSS